MPSISQLIIRTQRCFYRTIQPEVEGWTPHLTDEQYFALRYPPDPEATGWDELEDEMEEEE